MKEQLAKMTIIELVRTAHSYSTSIKQTGVYSELVREMASRLEALNLAHIGAMAALDTTAKRIAALEARTLTAKPIGYFAYDTDGGFTNHDTAERAQKEAQDAIEYFRESACDGWSDEVDSVCWGAIMQQAEKVDERPVTSEDRCAIHIECYCDYTLLPSIKLNIEDESVCQIQP